MWRCYFSEAAFHGLAQQNPGPNVGDADGAAVWVKGCNSRLQRRRSPNSGVIVVPNRMTMEEFVEAQRPAGLHDSPIRPDAAKRIPRQRTIEAVLDLRRSAAISARQQLFGLLSHGRSNPV